MGKVVGVIALVAVIFGLNYIGVPGYVAAVVIGFLGSFSLLGRNQNGRVREKLALLGAFVAGALAYSVFTGQNYGAFFGAVVFLAVGFGLTRLYKTDYRLWFKEMLPSILRFVMFERIGGAISGLGYKFSVAGVTVPVRYIEAIALLVAFVVLQYQLTKYIMSASQGAYGQRAYEGHKFRKLKGFGKFVTVVAVVIVWFNPANVLVIDNIKNSVFDSLTEFGGVGASAVTTISDTNGAGLMTLKSESPITDEHAALALLTSYDKELGGEFTFTGSEKLPSGDTVYNFVQTSNGIPLYGGGKKLVVGADNKPLYVVGTTKVGVDNLVAKSGAIGESAAHSLVASDFGDNDSISIGNAVKMWNTTSGSNAYSLTYAVPLSTTYGDDLIVRNNLILDAFSGEIVDIVGFNDGQHNFLSAVFEQTKEKGKFSDDDFNAIVTAADAVIVSATLKCPKVANFARPLIA